MRPDVIPHAAQFTDTGDFSATKERPGVIRQDFGRDGWANVIVEDAISEGNGDWDDRLKGGVECHVTPTVTPR